jgi:hypothetical protein
MFLASTCLHLTASADRARVDNGERIAMALEVPVFELLKPTS